LDEKLKNLEKKYPNDQSYLLGVAETKSVIMPEIRSLEKDIVSTKTQCVPLM